MRTYTHAALSYLAAARLSGGRGAAWAAAGAALPDAPALAGSAWLFLRRRRLDREGFYGEVCGRRRFGGPDAALHSAAVLVAVTAVSAGLAGPRGGAFLLGWAGHVGSDSLTHGADARPALWPFSGWRFRSPVSYRERGRHGRAFAAVEHAALAALAVHEAARWRYGAPARRP